MTTRRQSQIDLKHLFSVSDILQARGFTVSSSGLSDDLILPLNTLGEPEHQLLFTCLNNIENRKEILEKIKNPNYRPKNPEVIQLVNRQDIVFDRNKYSTTFEWYIGELVVKKFHAFSYAYGVEVEDIQRNPTGTHSGDFDVLVVLRNTNLLYIECKTGNYDRKSVQKCVDRAISLHCELSIMVIDDEVKPKKLTAMLEGVEHPLAKVNSLFELQMKGNPHSKVYEWMNCYFVSSTANIEEQIRTVLRVNEAKKVVNQYVNGISEKNYNSFGYEATEMLINQGWD